VNDADESARRRGIDLIGAGTIYLSGIGVNDFTFKRPVSNPGMLRGVLGVNLSAWATWQRVA
jgi:hypothetical protein